MLFILVAIIIVFKENLIGLFYNKHMFTNFIIIRFAMMIISFKVIIIIDFNL